MKNVPLSRWAGENLHGRGHQKDCSSYLEKGLDFSVEPPPLPVPQFEVGGAVPLQDADGVQLLSPLDVISVKGKDKG